MMRTIYTLPKYYEGDEVKEDEMGIHVVCMREMRNGYKILVRKPEGKKETTWKMWG
jgi:hypothetical protein